MDLGLQTQNVSDGTSSNSSTDDNDDEEDKEEDEEEDDRGLISRSRIRSFSKGIRIGFTIGESRPWISGVSTGGSSNRRSELKIGNAGGVKPGGGGRETNSKSWSCCS
uniref:Uncharacterized protein n=1 Tax=Cucumis sativus TaxID=3659 RepID=A0A0A0LG63_CUCSA